MQDCQTTRNVIQSYRVEKTAIVSVLADLCVKHRRVASDDWSSLDVALFHFLSCSLFEMGLINYDDQRLRFLVILGNELLRLGQEVDLAGSGEVLHMQQYVPNTVVKEDIRELTAKTLRVIAVYRKDLTAPIYEELTYKAKKIDFSTIDFPERFGYLKLQTT